MAGQRVPEAAGAGVGLRAFIPQWTAERLFSETRPTDGKARVETCVWSHERSQYLTVNDLALFVVSPEEWSGPRFYHFLLGSLD